MNSPNKRKASEPHVSPSKTCLKGLPVICPPEGTVTVTTKFKGYIRPEQWTDSYKKVITQTYYKLTSDKRVEFGLTKPWKDHFKFQGDDWKDIKSILLRFIKTLDVTVRSVNGKKWQFVSIAHPKPENTRECFCCGYWCGMEEPTMLYSMREFALFMPEVFNHRSKFFNDYTENMINIKGQCNIWYKSIPETPNPIIQKTETMVTVAKMKKNNIEQEPPPPPQPKKKKNNIEQRPPPPKPKKTKKVKTLDLSTIEIGSPPMTPLWIGDSILPPIEIGLDFFERSTLTDDTESCWSL